MTSLHSITLISVLLPFGAFGHSYGPAPKLTGAPGEVAGTCTSCHTGNALNSGTGRIQVLLAGSPTYVPGVKQRVVVQLSDAAQRRWGFELSARLNSDLTKDAGELTPVDNLTQVICDDNAPRPCSSGPAYITQTSAGSRNGLTGGASFQFDWTPPASGAGPVTFFAAGNAANGNSQSTGDFIYTTSVQLAPVTPAAPVISGVVSAANSVAGAVSPNSWVTVFGTNLSATTRSWNGDFVNGAIPASVDGVSVLVNQGGQARVLYVGYVSPTQINFLLPSDQSPFPGAVTVQVKNPAGISATSPMTVATAAAQLFSADGKYVLATRADGSAVGIPGRAAAKGETILVYATGLGATSPAQIAGQVPAGPASLAALPTATIGGTAATVVAGGVVPGSPGLYQLSLQVPTDAAPGDQAVVVRVGTTNTASVLLTVQ